jgi:hypothetical protein
MNVQVGVYLAYSGELEGLKPLIEDILDKLVANGYAVNTNDPDAALSAVVVVKESTYGEYSDGTRFLKDATKDAWLVVIPTKEEDSGEGSNDQSVGGREDQRR